MVATRRSKRKPESSAESEPTSSQNPVFEPPKESPKKSPRSRKKVTISDVDEENPKQSESVDEVSVVEPETDAVQPLEPPGEAIITSPGRGKKRGQQPSPKDKKGGKSVAENESSPPVEKRRKLDEIPTKNDEKKSLKQGRSPEQGRRVQIKVEDAAEPSKKLEKLAEIPGKTPKTREIHSKNAPIGAETKQEIKPVPKKDENVEVDFFYDDDSAPVDAPHRVKQESSRSCPYLDTINRNLLDFDFEKLCSVSLTHMNVYACLVCGKYFQGRGTNTHAYTHSVDIDHRVFLNLQTLRFYCLPDNYEIIDTSLDDIKYQLNPTFTQSQVDQIDSVTKLSRAMHGDEPYRPGVVGLNNLKANDYCNAVLHALSHIPPLRDYFLREENYANIKRLPGDKLVTLYQRFGELIRKLWNPKAFKSHVSPHEMLQAVVLCSKKTFQITQQGDAIDFLSWLLNSLHMSLNGTKRNSSSIIYKTFRGRMRVFSRKVMPVDTSEESRQRLLLTDEFKEHDEEIPFLYLTLDLPPAPLYRDEMHENIIPQVPLGTLLEKFNGTTEKEYKTYKENFMKRFELIRLPNFLIFYIKRFTKNAWYIEKNPTIVNFPIKNVDLFDCLSEDARLEHSYTTYDLVANVVHDGRPDAGKGTYRSQILHRATGKWFELEDLHVKEILPQMITLTESYIQIWELNRDQTREERRGEIEATHEPMEAE